MSKFIQKEFISYILDKFPYLHQENMKFNGICVILSNEIGFISYILGA